MSPFSSLSSRWTVSSGLDPPGTRCTPLTSFISLPPSEAEFSVGSTPDIAETLAFLRSLNKRLAFITNNATRSRQAYVDKVRSTH